MVEIIARRPDSTYWHVLWNGDTVGKISLCRDGWKFTWDDWMAQGMSRATHDEILDATREKETILNIARRLTS